MTTSSKVTTFADVPKKSTTNGHGSGGSVGAAKELNAWSLAMNTLYDAVVFLIASLGFVIQVSKCDWWVTGKNM